MDLAYSAEYEKFREEVREFLQQTQSQWPMGPRCRWEINLQDVVAELLLPGEAHRLMEQGGGYR